MGAENEPRVTGGDRVMGGDSVHEGEPHIDTALVRRLIAVQFPQWAHLPLARFPSAGTVNAVYRFGDRYSVRLPRVPSAVEDAVKEHTWLPYLAPHLPVAVPDVVALGRPGAGYPWPWSVHRWIDGTPPHEDRVAGPAALARDLGRFVTALRGVAVRPDGAGGPVPPAAYRGGPLAAVDGDVRAALRELAGVIDTAAAGAAWERALRAPAWAGPPVWVHSDLMPGNLLVTEDDGSGYGEEYGTAGRLTAVIDFGTVGVGDPACDLVPAWNLLPRPVRDVFRAAAHADDAMWARGRGWALSMALIQLPYYEDRNPEMAANARHVIREILGPQHG
jgi:aminoglycoside phosphotransferase (APT) family kinase protein